MELINRTPLPATVSVALSDVEGSRERTACLTAKATFNFDDDGHVELETQQPYPIFREDQETGLGLLPSDVPSGQDENFEVILLGCAYANKKGGTTQRTIRLSVGSTTREIAVFGDRIWLDRKTISMPAPFARLPLTFDRAFGGRCDLYLDPDSPLEISDPINPRGRGFDAERIRDNLATAYRFPPGMPALRYQRQLPNLEDPTALISMWNDAPAPVGWSTVPMDCGLRKLPQIRAITRDGIIPTIDTHEPLEHDPGRGHPQWTIQTPSLGSEVRLEGLTRTECVSFKLPDLRVFADYVLGLRAGVVALTPKRLVLLPEEGRFYIVYRTMVGTTYEPGVERCFRLRWVSTCNNIVETAPEN